MHLLVAARTDVGRIRSGNEDAFLVVDDATLVAVADGMGGHQGGEVASATAIEVLRDGVGRGDTIADAITAANDAVYEKAAQDIGLRGMGTTLTAGRLDGSTLVIGHVGDSRAYLLRGGDLRQVTADHSVIAELIAAGALTEDEALVDPRRSMITRALGIDDSVDFDVLTVDLDPGDRLLLCSDGLTTMIRDDAIREILTTHADRDDAADALVAAANDAGGADNITVVVADVAADDAPADEVADDAQAEVDEAGPGEAGPDSDDDPTDPEIEGLAEAAASLGAETAPKRRWWRRRS